MLNFFDWVNFSQNDSIQLSLTEDIISFSTLSSKLFSSLLKSVSIILIGFCYQQCHILIKGLCDKGDCYSYYSVGNDSLHFYVATHQTYIFQFILTKSYNNSKFNYLRIAAKSEICH